MFKVLIIITDDCESVETVFPIDILRRSSNIIELKIAGLSSKTVITNSNLQIHTDCLLSEVSEQDFDVIVLPGGYNNSLTLGSDPTVHSILEKQRDRKGWIAAICATPVHVLSQNKLMRGAKGTCYPTMAQAMGDDYITTDEPVHIDKKHKIITSKGPGTAADFGFAIIECLTGSDCNKLRNSMLC